MAVIVLKTCADAPRHIPNPLRPNTSSSRTYSCGQHDFHTLWCWCGWGEAEPLARLLGAGETGPAFGGCDDGSEMGKPIPGQGMACKNVHPRQVCTHACASVSSCWAREKSQPPGLPPAPCPYIAVTVLPEPPHYCTHSGSLPLAGPRPTFSGSSCHHSRSQLLVWEAFPSPAVHSQKYNPLVCQEHWILAGILMAYFKLKGVERGASRAELRTLSCGAVWGHWGLLLSPSVGQWTPVLGGGQRLGDRAVSGQSRRRFSQLHGGL